MTTYTPLASIDLALAGLLLVLNGVISIVYGLRIEKTLAVATVRMIVQLAAVAMALRFIFAQTSALWTLAFVSVMAGATLLEVVLSQNRRFRGWRALLLSSSPAFLSGLVTAAVALLIIQPTPWHAPRILLPILGMLVGNALSGVALALDAVTGAASRERREIEAQLALGASRYQAFSDVLRRGLRTGLTPLLNAMAAAGLVSLPGMMTGQILAGIDPVEAAKYQIMVLFLIAGATGGAVLAGGISAVWLLTDDRHRLRLDRLK